MEEDIRSLKVRILQLTQESQLWHEENVRLKARISEYYNWTQQANATMENLRVQIEALEYERNEFLMKEKQREADAGEMTFERLLDENQRLEVESREFKEDLEEAVDLLFRLFQTDLPTLDNVLKNKVADFLWKRGNESCRVFIGALRKGGIGEEKELADEVGVSVSTIRRVSERLERNGSLSKGKEGEVLLSREVRISSSLVQPTEWDTLDVEDLFENALTFFEREKDHKRVGEALEILRDVLVNKIGHSVFLYEISREAADWKKEIGELVWLRRKAEIWKEKSLEKMASQ